MKIGCLQQLGLQGKIFTAVHSGTRPHSGFQYKGQLSYLSPRDCSKALAAFDFQRVKQKKDECPTEYPAYCAGNNQQVRETFPVTFEALNQQITTDGMVEETRQKIHAANVSIRNGQGVYDSNEHWSSTNQNLFHDVWSFH